MGSVESKKRFFVRHLESEPMARLCRMLRIGRMTGYRWLARYRKSGLEGLLEEDSGGRPSKSLSAETRNAVLALRSKYGWNEKRIRSEIGNVSFHAVRQVLAEARLLGIAPPRRRRSFRSFERPLPNHLWQADFSFLDDNTWLFALLDDYSPKRLGATPGFRRSHKPSHSNRSHNLRTCRAQTPNLLPAR